MMWVVSIFAFVCGFAMDLVWTLCVDAVQMRRPLTAANMGSLIYFLTVISTVLIIEKCFLAVVAYMVGGWLGTYIVVFYRMRHS